MKNRKEFPFIIITISVVIGFLAVILTHNPVTNVYDYNYERTSNTGWVKVKHNDSTWWEEYNYDSMITRNNK